MIFETVALAQQAGGAAPQGPSIVEMLVPFAFIFMVMYFLVLRPQAKKAKDHQNLMGALKKGDEVVTSGGIIGKVTSVAEAFVTVEISQNTHIKVVKANIVALTKPQAKAQEKKTEKKAQVGKKASQNA